MSGPPSANVVNLPILVVLGRKQETDFVQEKSAIEFSKLRKEFAITGNAKL